MKRRDILKALPFAAGAVALPTAALSTSVDIEDPWVKADRLAHELTEALAQIENGRWSARIYGDGRAMNVVFRNELTDRRPVYDCVELEALHHAKKLNDAMQEICPGEWRTVVDHQHGFALVVNDAHKPGGARA